MSIYDIPKSVLLWLLAFAIVVSVLFGISINDLEQESKSLKQQVNETNIVDNCYFIHIDDDSGFLSSPDVMASYQLFGDDSGTVWIRVERYGFNGTYEFSASSVIEAEMILRGLVE
jgi:hypothetical protein